MTLNEAYEAIQKRIGNKDFMVIQFDWTISECAICKNNEVKRHILESNDYDYDIVLTAREFAGLYKNMTLKEFKNYCEIIRKIPGNLIRIERRRNKDEN